VRKLNIVGGAKHMRTFYKFITKMLALYSCLFFYTEHIYCIDVWFLFAAIVRVVLPHAFD